MGRNHEVKVKFSQAEFEKVKLKAEKLGLKPSVFLRMLALQSRVDEAVEEI